MTNPPNDAQQLSRLDQMLASGQISQAEHDQHRAVIINRMLQGTPAQHGYAYPPPPPMPAGRAPRKRHLGRWIGLAVAAIVVIAIIAAVASHGSKKHSPSVAQSGASQVETVTSGTPSESAASSPSATDDPALLAHVGDTIKVDDNDNDIHVEITLVAVKTKTRATDGISAPDRGHRYYAARFKVKNVGHSTYSDDIDNDANVSDAAGQQFDTDIVGSIAAGPLFPNSFRITAGDTRTGWVVFQVPLRSRITQVQYVTSSGFGTGAQWIVP